MNNMNKPLITTQLSGVRQPAVRSGIMQNQIPLLSYQGTNAVKPTLTSGNFVAATNNAAPSFILFPSTAVPGQNIVTPQATVNNTTVPTSGAKGITHIISTNQMTPNKGKIMLLTTGTGQLKTSQVGQTMNFTTTSQNKTTIATPNQQKIITGLTPSSTGQTIQFFTTIPGTNYSQNKYPVQVTTSSSSGVTKAPTATQIVTVIDNQNGQLQIRPAGAAQTSKPEVITPKIVPAPPAPEPIELNPEEAQKLLEANEELESSGSSTDTSTELVPGISNFFETKSNGISYYEQKELEEMNSFQKSDDKSGNENNGNIKKMTCSFGFTEYGVTAVTKPVILKGTKRLLKEDNDESRTQLNNPLKIMSSTVSVKLSSSPSSSPSSSSSTSSNTIQSNRASNVPKWQKDITDEEMNNIKAFASLNSTLLLKKLKDIHNTSFHLAIEEEKEMLKARFLNILDNHTEVNLNGHSCNLGTNDFIYSESKLCQPSESTSR